MKVQPDAAVVRAAPIERDALAEPAELLTGLSFSAVLGLGHRRAVTVVDLARRHPAGGVVSDRTDRRCGVEADHDLYGEQQEGQEHGDADHRADQPGTPLPVASPAY